MVRKLAFCIAVIFAALLLDDYSVSQESEVSVYDILPRSDSVECDFAYSGPYNAAEEKEFNKRRDAAIKMKSKNESVIEKIHLSGFGYSAERGDEIWLDGQLLSIDKSDNYDFKLLQGFFTPTEDGNSNAIVKNTSFFAAVLRSSAFYVFFENCDFSYANLQNSILANIDSKCKFYGAKISGAKISFCTKEQFLSTDPFIQNVNMFERFGRSDVKERILFDNVHLIRNSRGERNWQLDNVDFNRFNNGQKTAKKYIIKGCSFNGIDLLRCNFLDGELKKTNFTICNLSNCDFSGCKFVENQFTECDLENCNFSNAVLTNVSFSRVKIMNCQFDNADIQGTNFASGIGFHDPYNRAKKVNEHFRHETGAEDSDYSAISEKYNIKFHLTHGLKKEQLKTTSSFKNKKIIANKFCMDMRGLDMSGFNLTSSKFAGYLDKVNFTNAVITDCVFELNTNLTADQIKSTWNYKTGNMNGIKLPDEIQKQLDAEKQAVKN